MTFWEGFEKKAAVYSIPHNSKKGVTATMEKLRRLTGHARKAKG